ncbi:MAG: hypothetical protein M1296_02775 [Chloroflexi bacterium]|nr:hypothetical protein [Chloroflexota bacterium]
MSTPHAFSVVSKAVRLATVALTAVTLWLVSSAPVAAAGLAVVPLMQPNAALPESLVPPIFQLTPRDCACAAFAYLAHLYNPAVTLVALESNYSALFGYQQGNYCQPLQVERVLDAFGIAAHNASQWDWPPPANSVTYLYAGSVTSTHAVVVLRVTGNYVEYFDPFHYTSFNDETGIFFMSTSAFHSDWAGWWTTFSTAAH